MAKKTQNTSKAQKPIIYNIRQTSINRQKQDIQKWRNALIAAESKLNPRRTTLYDLYFDIILDAHLSSQLDKRRVAITNQNIVFQNESGEIEDITKLCQADGFVNMINFCLGSKFWGHSLIEFEFMPQTIKSKLIPRKHVEPHKGHILKSQHDIDGFSYREAPYTNYTFEVGAPDDLGLLLKAAPYILYKRGGFADWAQFCEIFGMPLRVGKYNGYDDETRQMLEGSLEQAGSASWIVIPEEANVDFVESKATGSNQLYSKLIEVCNSEISKLIVGQTMTADNGSSKSQADVHKEVEDAIHHADKLFILQILNTKFLDILNKHGYNTQNGWFGFSKHETMTLSQQADFALKINSVAPIDPQWFYDTFNFPPAKQDVQQQQQDDKKKEKQKETKVENRLFKRIVNFFQPPRMASGAYLANSVNMLYQNAPNIANLTKKEIDEFEKALLELAKKIHNGTFDGLIDEALTTLVAKKLSNAVTDGLGYGLNDVDFSTPDYDFRATIEKNIYQFSAAKNYHQLKDMTKALLDDNGAVRSFNEFRKAIEKINKMYNETWLQTEYNTALNASQNAARWKDYEENKEFMPYLQYEAVNDERTRESHRKLDGIVKRIDDPFWNKYYPPNDYNCRCTVIQLPGDDEIESGVSLNELPPVPKMFAVNHAKKQIIFPDEHPYFKGAPKKALKQGEKLINIENKVKTKASDYITRLKQFLG